MKIPPPSRSATEQLERLAPTRPNVTIRKTFGQPTAYVNGNMFFGVFGDELFVRLSDRASSGVAPASGFRPFEPMPGRPMRGYYVLPASVRSNPVEGRRWVAKALALAESLPPKTAGRKPTQ